MWSHWEAVILGESKKISSPVRTLDIYQIFGTTPLKLTEAGRFMPANQWPTGVWAIIISNKRSLPLGNVKASPFCFSPFNQVRILGLAHRKWSGCNYVGGFGLSLFLYKCRLAKGDCNMNQKLVEKVRYTSKVQTKGNSSCVAQTCEIGGFFKAQKVSGAHYIYSLLVKSLSGW